MFLLLISVSCMFLIEFLIRIYKPDVASHGEKIRLIRAIELTFFSPFLSIGMIQIKGDDISENLWFVLILTIAFLGLTIKKYLEYKNTT